MQKKLRFRLTHLPNKWGVFWKYRVEHSSGAPDASRIRTHWPFYKLRKCQGFGRDPHMWYFGANMRMRTCSTCNEFTHSAPPNFPSFGIETWSISLQSGRLII